MKVEVKLSGVDGVLKALKSLPPELVSKGGGPVRAALRKGAVVIRNQARTNLAAAIAAPGKTGITNSTGETARQIVIRRKRLKGGEKGERYVVTVAYKPHATSKGMYRTRKIHYNDIAFFLEAGEVGSSKIPAQPWMLPAFNAKRAEALSTIERELPKAILRIAKKHGLQVEGL